MASAGAIWGPATLRLLRSAAAKTTKLLRTKLAEASRPLQGQAQHAPLGSGFAGRQPVHPVALLRRQKRGTSWLSSAASSAVNGALRRFVSSGRATSAPRLDRSRLPSSKTSRRVAQSSGRAPFASTLRPNLTGGAMPRTAGGYSLGGGGARYFSHTPAAPAQVVQNVSQAMRAFFLSGQTLRYDGLGPRGERRYRAVSSLEDDAMRRLSDKAPAALGSFVDFQLSPTVTALSPLAAALGRASETAGWRAEATPATINTEGFLDALSADFGRALQSLTAVYADLRRLSALGDLPMVLERRDTLRVRFPGVDAATVERLCEDIGIQRGVVGQDPGFDQATGAPMALRFPFAPESKGAPTSPGGSARSLEGHELDDITSPLGDDTFVRDAFADDVWEAWASEPEGYESMSPLGSAGHGCSDGFEGLEGIYRFLEECDGGKGRLG